MEKQGFDDIASGYDHTFTHTEIGRMQRSVVWQYLEKIFKARRRKLKILDLNCGTGEDAIYFASLGHQVTAIDISGEMLTIAKEKAMEANTASVEFIQWDLKEMDQYKPGFTFDIILSNFGGLNCLDPDDLEVFAQQLRPRLANQGMLILVIMPDKCVVEKIYAAYKQDPRLRTRRQISPQMVKLGSKDIFTWYYSPADLSGIFTRNQYKRIKILPVGFVPSYLNTYLIEHTTLLKVIKFLDLTACNWSFLAGYADHFLISLEKMEDHP